MQFFLLSGKNVYFTRAVIKGWGFFRYYECAPGHFHKKTKGNYNQRFLVCLLNWNCFLLQMPVDEAACKYIALELVTLQCNK